MPTPNTNILEMKEKLQTVKAEMQKTIVWQDALIESLLIAVMTHWHVLLEWVPGIAKTLTVETLSKTLNLDFKRIQFTPDLLPSDLIGTEIYNIGNNSFDTKKWPIFANFILADEINRAPSKVQSALLEAMAEWQVTLGDTTFDLPKPFLVLATQNPIEQSWTYKLPEAELDRFLLKCNVSYPSKDEEKKIIEQIQARETSTTKKILGKVELKELKSLCESIHVSDNIYEYATDLVFATRDPSGYGLDSIKTYLNYWVSPRGSISLIKCSQARALLEWRDFVIPEDIKSIASSVLAHRLVLSYEALADWIDAENIISKILEMVKIR
jgi:MoxR-like ATPase